MNRCVDLFVSRLWSYSRVKSCLHVQSKI